MRTVAYNPLADAAERWPGWTFLPTDLRGIMPMLMCSARRVILLDEGWYQMDEDAALAHAIAHLDLGHHQQHQGGRITVDDARQAEWLAQIRLDREGSR